MSVRKVLFSILVLCALLAGTAGNARAANGLLTLIEVRNDPLGGVIFVFEVSGEFGRQELRNGTVHVQGADGDYDIDCNRVAPDLLQCTTTQKVADKYVWLNLAGFIFWTYVPPRPEKVETQYCYGIYDWPAGEGQGLANWTLYGTHCQDAPANPGDMLLDFNNPVWGLSDYTFLPVSPACEVFNPLSLPAYYYECFVAE